MAQLSGFTVNNVSSQPTFTSCLYTRAIVPQFPPPPCLGVLFLSATQVLPLSQCSTEPHDGKSLLSPSRLFNGRGNFEMIYDGKPWYLPWSLVCAVAMGTSQRFTACRKPTPTGELGVEPQTGALLDNEQLNSWCYRLWLESMTSVCCNYIERLNEQKGIILGEVKGSARVFACRYAFI